MRELLAPLVELFAYALVAIGLTTVGLFAELMSVGYLSAGNLPFAVWLFVMGALALYAGIVALGFGEVLPWFRALLASR